MTITTQDTKPFLWFDLDDTLWDMTGNSDIVLEDLFNEDPDVRRHFLDKGPEVWNEIYHRENKKLWEEYSAGRISRDFLRIERFARPFRIAGADNEDALKIAQRLDTDYLKRLGACTGIIPGAMQLLDRLSAEGYPMGLISNGFCDVQFNKLDSAGMRHYFPTVVLSDDIGVNKPDRRIFDHALRCAGLNAADSILIGDNPITDILGALRAGWVAVWYNPADMPAPDELREFDRFYRTVTDLSQITSQLLETLHEINRENREKLDL